jgi:parallel beta-helix repeat protein
VGTTNSTVTGNSITKNQEGIRMVASSDNVLRNNSINDNVYNLWIQNGTLNNIDTSNTVDGRPVIYWVNQHNRTVPVDAGYVALINCKDIVAQNLNITNNRQAMLLSYTTNSSIIDNQISNNYHGIQLENCTGINITGNSVKNNQARGIYLQGSNNNSIKNNAITENGVGIQIGDKHIGRDDANVNNQIVGNNITENRHGIEIELLSINMFYHNSFINNKKQFSFTSYAVEDESLLLNWDNGVEGNYWSDHINNDTNHDGIVDTEYEITTIFTGFTHVENGPSVPVYITIADRYPINGMFVSFTQSEQSFNVVSNSTISSFQYNEAENSITLQAITEGFGFCRIAIPHTAMNVDSISVVIDSGQVLNPDYHLYDDGSCRWIYFAYPEGTQEIQITAQQP